MSKTRRAFAVALILAAAGSATSATFASAFVAWKVAGISSDDVLMVRAYPSSSSRILVGYPNGVMLSMTGRCAGDVRLDEIQALPESAQRAMIRSEWCEVWLDPYATGDFRNGWVFGRYIRPA